MISQRTMPESDFTSEDSDEQLFQQENDFLSENALLSVFELQTVLDMLAAMEMAEELTQLQALTEMQKRQVWEATPEPLKQKLWQLRHLPAPVQPTSVTAEPADEIQEDTIQESEAEAEREDEIEDLGQDIELTENSYAFVQSNLAEDLAGGVEPNLSSSVQPLEDQAFAGPCSDRTIPAVGDRIVLKAHPKLTLEELKAIWLVEQIQGSKGNVSHEMLGTRSYPLTWMAIYSRGQSEPEAKDLAENLDDEEAF